jgi:tetratricopeptide (TPR) repeat protein
LLLWIIDRGAWRENHTWLRCGGWTLTDPENADHFNNRAIAKKKAGLLIEAVSDYTNALQLNPKLYRIYLNRGITYYELGNTVAACSDFTVARNNGVPNADEALRKAGCI